MKAVVLKDGEIRFESTYPRPVPAKTDALINVRLAGICATDLEMVHGYVSGFAGVLGHEFVGKVVQSGWREWVGRRVVASINIGCGRCAYCRRGVVEHCPERQVPGIHSRDGVFAEQVLFPVRNLYAVPDEVSDEMAVFTEPLAAALRIREQVRISPSMHTAVIGPGRLGLLVGQVLTLDGTRVTILGRSADSLVLPAKLGLETGLAAELPPNQFDLVVEATGNSSGLEEAMRLVKPLGTLVLKSTFAGGDPLNPTPLVVKEINVVGSRCGPFAPALRLLAAGAVDVTPLIEATYPLSAAAAAFAHAARRGVRKVLLQP